MMNNLKKSIKDTKTSTPAAASAAAAVCFGKEDTVVVSEEDDAKSRKATMKAVLNAQVRAKTGKGKTGKSGGQMKPGKFRTKITVPFSLASDASGNLPFATTIASLLGPNAEFGLLAALFDLCTVHGVTVHMHAKQGYKNTTAFTPVTAAGTVPIVRIFADPDGSVSNPSVANALAIDMGNPMSRPKDIDVREGGTWVMPAQPTIFRQTTSSVNARSLWYPVWADCGDVVTSSAYFVGGFNTNTIVAGSMPNAVSVLGAYAVIDVEFTTGAV